MGVTKQYLRYLHGGQCNAVGSANGAVVVVDSTSCAVSACENVNFYNLRTQEKTSELSGSKKSVTCLKVSGNRRYFAVGYADGTIRLYDKQSEDESKFTSFAGHKKGVNCLAFSNDGLTLASGGKDSTIVLWDIVSETGIVRLNGHKDSITHLQFTNNDNFIVSASKDTFVKMWHVESRTCFYTIVDHKSEVYSFVLLKNDSLLVTASAELELFIFDLEWIDTGALVEDEGKENGSKKSKTSEPVKKETEEEGEMANRYVKVRLRGRLLRQSKGRALQLALSPDHRILACLGSGQMVDIFRVYSNDEASKRLSKKLKKAKRKAGESGDSGPTEADIAKDVTVVMTRIGDYRASKDKVKWVDFAPEVMLPVKQEVEEDDYEKGAKGRERAAKTREGDTAKAVDAAVYSLYVLCKSNTVQQVRIAVNFENNETSTKCVANLDRLGHREDVRSLDVSSNNAAFISGGGDQVLVWNMHSLRPVNTLRDERMKDVTAVCFAAGDNHIVAATKTGSLHLFELATTELVETRENAHDGCVWQILPTPDKKRFVTGAADKTVKFWSFVFVEEGPRHRLSMRETRSLSLPDECLSIAISPNGKFILAALLDCTVGVYFMDTLKFFLSLYGHSLPVTCVTVSPDSKVAVSGSADKTIKIWGLDFGDCHKSFHAHDETVSAVLFSPSEEMLVWSAGRDGKVKQWDAVKRERVQELSLHSAEVRALAQTSDGNVMLSASHDRSIRVWELSEEILVLEEESEMEREEQHFERLAEEEDVIAGESRVRVGEGEGEEVAIPGSVASLAAVKSRQSIASTEQICEAVEIVRNEKEAKANDNDHKQHPLITAMGSASLEHFLVDVIGRVQPSNLERALLMVPFGFVPDLLRALSTVVTLHYRAEFSCRVALFLIRIHYTHVVNSIELMPLVDKLRKEMPAGIVSIMDMYGMNLAALQLLQLEYEETHQVQLFDDVADIQAKETKKRKTKERKAILKTFT